MSGIQSLFVLFLSCLMGIAVHSQAIYGSEILKEYRLQAGYPVSYQNLKFFVQLYGISIYDASDESQPKFLNHFEFSTDMDCYRGISDKAKYHAHENWLFGHSSNCGLIIAEVMSDGSYSLLYHNPAAMYEPQDMAVTQDLFAILGRMPQTTKHALELYRLNRSSKSISLASQTSYVDPSLGTTVQIIQDRVLLGKGRLVYDISNPDSPHPVPTPSLQGLFFELENLMLKFGHGSLISWDWSEILNPIMKDRVDIHYRRHSDGLLGRTGIISQMDPGGFFYTPFEVDADGAIHLRDEFSIPYEQDAEVLVNPKGSFTFYGRHYGHYRDYRYSSTDGLIEQGEYRKWTDIRSVSDKWVWGVSYKTITYGDVHDRGHFSYPAIVLDHPNILLQANKDKLFVHHWQNGQSVLEVFDVQDPQNAVSLRKIIGPMDAANPNGDKEMRIVNDVLIVTEYNSAKEGTLFFAYDENLELLSPMLDDIIEKKQYRDQTAVIHDIVFLGLKNQGQKAFLVDPQLGFLELSVPFMDQCPTPTNVSFFYEGHYYIHCQDLDPYTGQFIQASRVDLELVKVQSRNAQGARLMQSLLKGDHLYMYAYEDPAAGAKRFMDIQVLDLRTWTKVQIFPTRALYWSRDDFSPWMFHWGKNILMSHGGDFLHLMELK